jgi:hypothetical protein
VIGIAQISVANTALDGTGTLATVITGAADGTRISRITIKATGNTTAGIVRLFIADNATPANIRLWREVSVTAITVSGTVTGFRAEINLPAESALVLPSGWSLRAGTHNAETFNVFAEGGNY